NRKNMNLQERSIKDHECSFRYFKKYVFKYKQTIKTLNDVTYQDIQDYITYLREEKIKWDDHPDFLKRVQEKGTQVGLEAGTVNKRLRDLKAQFNFWHKHNYIENNVASEVKLLKQKNKSLNLTEEHIERVFAQFDKINEE